MSKNAEKFIEKMSKDNKFRKKVADLYHANARCEIEQLAAEMGLACSFDELIKTLTSQGLHGRKLSDDELEIFAAGASVKGGGK
jgi:predicted ribosomally synthesized peptide with nif11-like leader